MKTRVRPRAIGTRYDQREIAARVEKVRQAKHMERKEVYYAIRAGRDGYSRKASGETPFSLWELSVIADLFNMGPGWPFITEDQAEILRHPACCGARGAVEHIW